jgi:hypothetical protein
MRGHIATASTLLAAIALAGCLVSATENFQDHKDKIRLVDRLGFEAELHPQTDGDAVIGIEFRKGGGAWMTLLSGIPVPGASTAARPAGIAYEKTEALLQNFAAFQTVVEGGVFDLRVVTEGGNDAVTIDHLLLIVTFTVGI